MNDQHGRLYLPIKTAGVVQISEFLDSFSPRTQQNYGTASNVSIGDLHFVKDGYPAPFLHKEISGADFIKVGCDRP
jgi:hypothetical protein